MRKREIPVTWEEVYFISVVVVHIVLVVLIIAALLRGAGADPIMLGGRKMLRPSRVLFWSGILFAIWSAGGISMIVEALGRERGQASGLLVGFMVTLAFGLAAAWMLARYSRHRIIWNDKGLDVSNWQGVKRRYRWEDLTGVVERRGKNSIRGLEGDTGSRLGIIDLELRFGDEAVVRAAPNMTGYFAFVNEVKERGPVEQQE